MLVRWPAHSEPETSPVWFAYCNPDRNSRYLVPNRVATIVGSCRRYFVAERVGVAYGPGNQA
ncbi:hypothetical protein SAMN05444166_1350 [Singulisphaera sp. GP187]|nr:hypothetical protein SAMN05444166_1350 [Singulisphaera sp. GP187]